MLVRRHRLAEKTRQRLLSWEHSGFSVWVEAPILPEEVSSRLRLARYLVKAPVSLERLECNEGACTVVCTCSKRDERRTLTALDFMAELSQHIPDRGQNAVVYHGRYSNRSRGERRKVAAGTVSPLPDPGTAGAADPDPGFGLKRRAFRLAWAALLPFLARLPGARPLAVRSRRGQRERRGVEGASGGVVLRRCRPGPARRLAGRSPLLRGLSLGPTCSVPQGSSSARLRNDFCGDRDGPAEPTRPSLARRPLTPLGECKHEVTAVLQSCESGPHRATPSRVACRENRSSLSPFHSEELRDGLTRRRRAFRQDRRDNFLDRRGDSAHDTAIHRPRSGWPSRGRGDSAVGPHVAAWCSTSGSA